MTTIPVLNADGNRVDVELPLAPGRVAATSSRPVALSNEDKTALDALATKLDLLGTYVDGVEALLAAVRDRLPAGGSATETTLASLVPYVDGLETLIGSTNTKLDTLAGYVDGLEAALAGTLTVGGTVAEGTTDAGNPMKVGGRAKTALPTAVTDSQRISALFDKFGRQVKVNSLREQRDHQKTTITSSTAETTIVSAQGANVFADLYGLVVANTSATACNVTLKDAAAGTTRFVLAVPAGEVRGFVMPSCDGHKQAVGNSVWTVTCSASVASIEVTAMFVRNM